VEPEPDTDPAGYARKIWARAIPIAGTVAERYLREHRGIAGPLPECLRFSHGVKHKEANRYLAALLVPVFDQAGELRRVQAVFLDRHTGEKAAVPEPKKKHGKKTFGRGASAIPAIFPGRKPGRRFDVVLTEGPEDGVALWSALEDEGGDVAATLGDKNLHQPEFPPGTRLLIVADNDAPGARAAQNAAAAHAVRGCDVWIASPPAGIKDSNDLLRAAGTAGILAMLDAAERFVPAPPLPPPVVPTGTLLTTADAAELGRQAVRRFIEQMLAWTPAPPDDPLDYNTEAPPPAVALRASVGLGKSEMILRELVRPELAGKRVHYFVPLVKLGNELVERFNALAIAGSPEARLFLGREQILPDGSLMCEKRDLASQLGRARLNVQQHLCERRVTLDEINPDTGKQKTALERCPHFERCRYQAQRADRRPGIVFMAHEYLFLPDTPAADAIVIDERYYPASLRGIGKDGYFAVLDDLRLPRRGVGDNVNADLVALGERCIRALRAGGRLADFEAAGITAEQARWAKSKEYGRLQPLDITPAMPQSRQEERIAAYRQQTAAKLGRFFALLATAFDAGADPRFAIREEPNGDDRPEERVFMLWSEPVRLPPAPTLLLDADLDVTIARRHFPQLEEVITAEVRPEAYHGTQITDQRLSMGMTCVSYGVREAIKKTGRLPDELSAKDRTRVRNVQRIRRIAEVKAAGGRRGLIVSYKAVEEVLNVLPPIPGVEYAHFGALRGRDCWKNLAFVIVAGAPLANTDELERMTNALWRLDAEPLATIAAAADGRRRYPDTDAEILMADGARVPVRVPTHPDPRCRAIMAQLFAEVPQAIGRLRLPHRPANRPCEIILLTNTPTGLPMHRLTTWDDIQASPVEVMMARGIVPQRLRDIARVLPELIESGQADPRSAVSKALASAGVDPNELFTFPYKSPSIAKSEQLALARYRLEGERQSALAWVDVQRYPDPRDAIEAALGPLDRFELVEEPPAAAATARPRQDDGTFEPVAEQVVPQLDAPIHGAANNAKRAEAARLRARQDDGTFGPVVAQLVQPPAPKVAVTREAKAAFSKTNRGAVERMGTQPETPDLDYEDVFIRYGTGGVRRVMLGLPAERPPPSPLAPDWARRAMGYPVKDNEGHASECR
jgi:hypothetical protein